MVAKLVTNAINIFNILFVWPIMVATMGSPQLRIVGVCRDYDESLFIHVPLCTKNFPFTFFRHKTIQICGKGQMFGPCLKMHLFKLPDFSTMSKSQFRQPTFLEAAFDCYHFARPQAHLSYNTTIKSFSLTHVLFLSNLSDNVASVSSLTGSRIQTLCLTQSIVRS